VRRPPWQPLLILVLTLLAFAPALTGGFIWDDDDYVTHNPNLHSLAGLRDIWLSPPSSPQYYPLVHTSFWIENHLWGLHPTGYHVVNVLLHATASVLLWRVLRRLEVPGALLGACLFAIHPVQVESVAWVTERKNVLSAVFYFASAVAFLKSDTDRRAYRQALFWFVCALLSKTVTCTLPAALVLILWWKRGRVDRRDWLRLAPMFVLGAALGAFTAYWERDWVRAVGPEWNYSWVDRVLIAGRAVWFYASKLVLPVGLSFIYPKWTIDPRAAWQWAFPAGVIAALFVLWRMRDRWGRGPLVATLIFAGTLVPALGFFNIYPMRYSLVADHFQYHACAALLALIAAGIHRHLFKLPAPARYGVFLAPLLVLTMVRSSVFRTSESLWRDTLAKNPNSWMVHLNLARTLRNTNPDEAALHFRRQVELAPELAETHWNYASSLFQSGQLDAAIAEYTRAIDLGGNELPQAYVGRGQALLAVPNVPAAIADFRTAVDLKPDYAAGYNWLGTALAKDRQTDAAIAAYAHAIDLDPALAEARVSLAALLVRKGELDAARKQFDIAVRIDPSKAQFRDRVFATP
jgi:Flp pilus assembly protein TadD/uncharacterized membrane protein YfcA